jgi:hypothetical protein
MSNSTMHNFAKDWRHNRGPTAAKLDKMGRLEYTSGCLIACHGWQRRELADYRLSMD